MIHTAADASQAREYPETLQVYKTKAKCVFSNQLQLKPFIKQYFTSVGFGTVHI